MATLYEILVKALKKDSDPDRRMALREQPPKNKSEAQQYLAQMGDLRREVDLIQAGMEERIAQIRAEAELAGWPLADKYTGLEEAVAVWAELNRAELTDNGKRQEVNLGNGFIKWRLLPPSVKPPRDLEKLFATIEMFAEDDPDYWLFIRTKREVNKEAMAEYKEKALKLPGVKIGSEGETLTITPLFEELEAAKSIN
jgi:phage host-nuclease inhibitor protein Gam